MINFKKYIFIVALILIGVPLIAQNNRVTFEVNIPNRIVAGEPFQVQFVVNDSGKDMKLADPTGLDVLYGPAVSKSSQVVIVNGKRTQSKATVFTYTLLANKAGDYMIPAASVKVGNSTYKTAARKIKVFSAEAANNSSASVPAESQGERVRISGKELYVSATPNKKTVFEQEPILVNFKLYSSRQPNDIPKIKLPDFDGFIKEEVDLGSMRQIDVEEVNGKLYYTVNIYSVLLYPQKAGQLTIPEGSFDVYMLVRVDEPVESFFGSFHDQYQEVNQTVKSRPFSINVKPLPDPKPEGFDGAVGQFNFTHNIPTYDVRTNESFSMKLSLEGKGNLKLIQIPDPVLPEGFETYDPKTEEEITATASGSRGKKVKEIFAVPRYTGDFVIPEIKFSYFDPNSASYKTIKIPEVKLHVAKGSGDSSTAVSGISGKEDVKYLGNDIRYIKSAKSQTKYRTPSLLQYYISLVGYILMIGVIFYIDVRKEKNNLDTSSNRSRKAGTKARKYLLLAGKNRSKGEAAAYYEALSKGLISYLSDKYHIPLSELSKDNINSVLMEKGVPNDLISEVLSILSLLEMSRYTPMEAQSERDELYDRASNAIDRLEKIKVTKK